MTNRNNVSDTAKENCCGCTACLSVCPSHAIEMKADKKGFLYPRVDETKCVQCRKCIMTCGFDKFAPSDENGLSCYAARLKDREELKQSQSGGFFAALAEYVIQKGGVVFGCLMDNARTAIHCMKADKEGIVKFKGSKYVQSDLRGALSECAQMLHDGKLVLFSGTPCQIDGLISYLDVTKTDRKNLVTADIVCHGTPSPLLWGNFAKHIEKKHNNSISCVNFRDKSKFGWKATCASYCLDSGVEITSSGWSHIYYKNIMFRDSCYNCSYTTPYRHSDFTMADYWNVENVAPSFNDGLGVSMVLTHNDKARTILTELKERLEMQETSINESLQPNLKSPSIKGKDYDAFWSDFSNLSEKKFMQKWFFPSKASKLLRILKKKLGLQTR